METNLKMIYVDMLTQFPKEELKSFEEFEKNLKLPQCKLHVYKPEGEIVGYSVWFIDDEMEFLWLDYIAILKDFHSRGYGSLYLRDFIKEYSDKKYCFFEVEKPIDEQSIRRQKFYEKLGCKNTGIKYFFPNKYKKLEMDLLYLGINTDKAPEKEYTNAVIRKVHKIIHNSDWDALSKYEL